MSLTIYAYIRFRKLRYRYEFYNMLPLKFALKITTASSRLNGAHGLR